MAAATLSAFLFFLPLLAATNASFEFHGFNRTEAYMNMALDEGTSIVKSNGLLMLTNRSKNIIGHAFYSKPIQMFDKLSHSKVSSFSTSFVFSIVSPSSGPGGFGLAFTIAPSKQFPNAGADHFLGLFNSTNDGNDSNHIFAVEFDTVNGYKGDFDTEGNHVGVNINGMSSTISEPAAYVEENTDGRKEEFNMEKSDGVHAWIEYDGQKKILNVTIAPLSSPRPTKPLISSIIDLNLVLKETMFVGFSASTGKNKASSHYILGWSFSVNGDAPFLNSSQLPKPPPKEKDQSFFPWVKFTIGILSALILTFLCLLTFITLYKRHMRFETLEDWELDCPHRFRYKDLHIATKGFKESQLIGVGGFGAVYKGILPNTGTEVAVKRIMRSPTHGMREFAAEIESLGRLRHKNLVNLQGWCKQKNDLLLIYDYIPNGSLDSLLFSCNDDRFSLIWDQRFNILKGVAAALLYLHEEWEQVVIHRDVKSSNILIDENLNARLGDFGLARLYNHGQVSHSTSVVGTIGYIAPELTRTGKASTSSDVYAYGVLLLEVVTGRRPIDSGQFFLVDWVIENYQLGQLLEVVDPKMDSVYVEEEVELVLKLGLICTQYKADNRPSMIQVIKSLNFEDPHPGIADWRHSDSLSSGMSSSFLKVLSMSTTTTSCNISSIGKSSMAVEISS